MAVNGTIYSEITLVSLECYRCSVPFAITTDFQRRRREDHESFYCPNGHSQSYNGKSEAEKGKERANSLAQQLASREEDLRVERASHAATKGKLTKVQKRVTHGVCPCCNRTFANVQRHMKTQHPDKVAEAGT